MASISSRGGFQTLPADIIGLMSDNQFMAPEDLCTWSKVNRECRAVVAEVQRQKPAYVQRRLLHKRGVERQLEEIRERKRRLAAPAAPAEPHENAEEERTVAHLNILRERSHLPGPPPSARSICERVQQVLGGARLPLDHPLFNVIDMEQWNLLRPGRLPDGSLPHRPWPHRPLPEGTAALLSQPCPIFRDKRIDETHICVDPPTTVGGQRFTLNQMQRFAEHSRGNQVLFSIDRDLRNTPGPEAPCFLLKTCLPGTKGKTYQEQLEVLKRYPEYREATLPQVLFASIMEYIRSGTRPFDNELVRTSTTGGVGSVVFGGFGDGWPSVSSYDHYDEINNLGLAVVRRPGPDGSSPVLGPR